MRIVATNEASRQKDVISLVGDTIKGKLERDHDKQTRAQELFADGLKTALNAKVKPTKGD